MEETLKIGLILKPQGIKGQVKIQPLTDDISRFNKLSEVLIEGKPFKVFGVRICDGFVMLSIFGVSDRNAAEGFRGKFISVKRENAVALKKDNYFIADIIGCTVITDKERVIGEVVEVTSAKTDIFTVKNSQGKIARFPFLKDSLVGVDVENKKITVKDKRINEIICYED